MNGGQVTLNAITDAQLEALIDVKKANEGQFQLTNVQCLGGPAWPPCGPPPVYGPGSAWGMGPGHPGMWFGPGSPFGPVPPGMPGPGGPPPAPQAQSTYNVTLNWQQDQGFKAIATAFDRMAAAN